MTKQDITLGYIVQCNNGWKMQVISGGRTHNLLNLNTYTITGSLDDYNDDLIHKFDRNLDIKLILSPDGEIIWAREVDELLLKMLQEGMLEEGMLVIDDDNDTTNNIGIVCNGRIEFARGWLAFDDIKFNTIKSIHNYPLQNLCDVTSRRSVKNFLISISHNNIALPTQTLKSTEIWKRNW